MHWSRPQLAPNSQQFDQLFPSSWMSVLELRRSNEGELMHHFVGREWGVLWFIARVCLGTSNMAVTLFLMSLLLMTAEVCAWTDVIAVQIVVVMRGGRRSLTVASVHCSDGVVCMP